MRYRLTEEQLGNIIKETIDRLEWRHAQEVDARELANFCLTNDFYFVCDGGMFGRRERCANSSEIQKIIASEVLRANKLEFTHEADDEFRHANVEDDWRVRVVKVTMPDEEYYIAWEI